MSIKSYDERLKEQEELLKEQKEANKALVGEQFDTNAQTIKENYGTQIEDTNEAYEHKFRENAVQKLINERQIAENMANLGLTDSGLNRTQMTANQLSYANNNAEYSRQRQKAVEKLNTTMNQLLTENETKKKAALSDIDNTYKDTASKNAMSLYTSDVDAENERIKAEIEAENERIKANNTANKERFSAQKDLIKVINDTNMTREQKLPYIYSYINTYGDREKDTAAGLEKIYYFDWGRKEWAQYFSALNTDTDADFAVARVEEFKDKGILPEEHYTLALQHAAGG